MTTKKIEGPGMNDLVSAAKDINDVIIPEPELPTKVGTKKTVLMSEIKEVGDIITEDDIKRFEKNTVSVLTELGVIEAEETDKVSEKETKKEEKPTKKTPAKKDNKPAEKKTKDVSVKKTEIKKGSKTKKTKKVSVKKPADKADSKPKKTYTFILFNMISKAKHTSKEIVSAVHKKFPASSKHAISSWISHQKNPNYNNIGFDIIESKKGILSVKEQ